MNQLFLVPIGWGVLGLVIWLATIFDSVCPLDESDLSLGQLVLVRVIAGPIVWILSAIQLMWWALSYLGPRIRR